jgi:hypothetical protein
MGFLEGAGVLENVDEFSVPAANLGDGRLAGDFFGPRFNKRLPENGAAEDAGLVLEHAGRDGGLDLAAAISAVCAAVSVPSQSNIVVWNVPRWSKGRMYSCLSNPNVITSFP